MLERACGFESRLRHRWSTGARRPIVSTDWAPSISPIVNDMTQEDVIEFVTAELEGTVVVVASEDGGDPEMAWGDTFFFYDPDGITVPERRLPYATIVTNDYPGFDEASNLNRTGVYRVNAWVSRDTFELQTSSEDASTIDYAALDKVIPHPVYGPQSWLSVLNPGADTKGTVKELLVEAHDRARTRYEKQRTRKFVAPAAHPS